MPVNGSMEGPEPSCLSVKDGNRIRIRRPTASPTLAWLQTGLATLQPQTSEARSPEPYEAVAVLASMKCWMDPSPFESATGLPERQGSSRVRNPGVRGSLMGRRGPRRTHLTGSDAICPESRQYHLRRARPFVAARTSSHVNTRGWLGAC